METPESDLSANQKRKIAYQVLRKNFQKLARMPPKEVCDFLYSDGVISPQEFEHALIEELDSRDRMRKMIMKLQTVSQDDHKHFENFCDFLEDSFDSPGLHELGTKLKQAYMSGLESAEDRSSEEQQPITKRGTDYLKRLRQDISVIQKRIYQSDENLDAKYSIIKESIKEYITTLLHTGSKEAEVESQLKVLCYEEILVPSKLHSWCFETLKVLSQQLQQVQPTSDVLPQPAVQPPQETQSLFSKDVVYHAMLLCNTVESCDETSYQQYLSKEPHQFEEVSISVLPTDKQSIERYIIAKKKKMLYIAFRGEPILSEWSSKYSSFLEGIEYQTKQIPVRFFAEQIREGFQIVLTGFSFGGLLAVSVAASIWQQTYITVAELTKNVVCVGFGVPMITLPALSKTLTEYPAIESTIHLVYLKDDIIPRLMRFMNHQMVPPLQSVLALTSGDTNLSQNSQFSYPLFECLSTLQSQTNFEPTPQEALLQQVGYSLVPQMDESRQSSMTAIQKLKSLLGICLSTNPPPANAQLPILGVFQLIFTDVNGKLTMQDLASHAAQTELDFLSIQAVAQLTSQLFKQHYVSEYQIRLSRSYLERQRASYSPRFSSRYLPLVKILKPSVSTAAFYRHGDEIAMVLEGDNLWFCHQIEVPVSSTAKTHAIKTPASDITRCSIQFNYKPICDDDFLVNLKAEDIQVTLFSHFSKPLRDQTALIVCKEGYEISLRQSQLAKHPPSELIELAYLCATLEQPSSLSKITKPSKRKQLITEFLENAVRIVPIESICHAITHCDEGVALKCVEAFTGSSLKFMPSLLFDIGCELALTRITTRVTPDTIEQLEQQAMQNLPADRQRMYLPTVFRQDDKEISVTVSAFVGDKKEKEITSMEKQMSYSEAAAKGTKASPQTLSEESPFGLNLFMCSKTVELPKRRVSSHKYTEEQYADLTERLHAMTVSSHKICARLACQNRLNVISGANIEELYPLKPKKQKLLTLKSPIKVLTHARREIFSLRKRAHQRLDVSDDESAGESSLENAVMLKKVNDIWQNDLKICASLLGAFMEQQIKVPLVQDSSLEMAKALYTTEAPAAVGIWSLFSLHMLDVERMVDTAKGKTLLVQITNYIKSFCSEREEEDLPASDGRYAGKMQFLLQCLQNRVSCNSQYISYSLERQLATLCERYEIDPSTRVEQLVQNWYRTFQGNILTLVKPAFRPLLARWLIWSLAVHKLREGLASYTTVGVIGLVNSGKSKLVETLFNREVLTGTLELQRTTVPFMYNLDDVVEGLSVIDFPGVDDRDESIPGLAKLLLTLAQLVILVVDYRKIRTESAKKWLDILDHESVPYLVCLTHADKLYANHLMKKHGINCPSSVAKREIGKELERVKERLGRSPNRSMQFYSFSQDFDSSLSSKEGRQALQAAEIGCPRDVGDWIEGKLRGYLHLDDVASKLKHYLDENNA